MEENILEKFIIGVLKNEAGNMGMRSKDIQRYLPEEANEISTFKIGSVCGSSEKIEKVHENKRGGRWHVEGEAPERDTG